MYEYIRVPKMYKIKIIVIIIMFNFALFLIEYEKLIFYSIFSHTIERKWKNIFFLSTDCTFFL